MAARPTACGQILHLLYNSKPNQWQLYTGMWAGSLVTLERKVKKRSAVVLPRQASVLYVNACGPVKQVEAEHLQVTPSRRASCLIAAATSLLFFPYFSDKGHKCKCYGAEERKFNCLIKPELEPKLRTAAPAPLYLPQAWRYFTKKNHDY